MYLRVAFACGVCLAVLVCLAPRFFWEGGSESLPRSKFAPLVVIVKIAGMGKNARRVRSVLRAFALAFVSA